MWSVPRLFVYFWGDLGNRRATFFATNLERDIVQALGPSGLCMRICGFRKYQVVFQTILSTKSAEGKKLFRKGFVHSESPFFKFHSFSKLRLVNSVCRYIVRIYVSCEVQAKQLKWCWRGCSHCKISTGNVNTVANNLYLTLRLHRH